jgi:hypothetical protein
MGGCCGATKGGGWRIVGATPLCCTCAVCMFCYFKGRVREERGNEKKKGGGIKKTKGWKKVLKKGGKRFKV